MRGRCFLLETPFWKNVGITKDEVLKPRVVSNQVIRSVEAYQAQINNRNRQGMMLIPGQSLFILETEPAAWAVIAANGEDLPMWI